MKDAALFGAITVGAYAVSAVLEYAWNLLFRAPSAIHAGSITELADFRKRALEEVHKLREEAEGRLRSQQLATQEGIQKIAALEEVIAQKRPHDEHKEAWVGKALTELNESQRRAFIWLLDADEASRERLQGMGLDADYFFRRGDFPPLLVYRSVFSANGIIEMDRFYSINPKMADALRNVAYPPPRPVTPLQS